ncbi:MAG: PilT/PilU family type 4a pilus ATPase [Elusimicrobia bacterium]|nr:PilT/PilU family type 4a pilus ATPase [Elusimicrobiota bacterium]
MNVKQLLQLMLRKGISDIHFKANAVPLVRIHGSLSSVQSEPLSADYVRELAYSLMNEEQRQRFEEHDELDISYEVGEVSRFRVNIYRQRGTVALTLRVVPFDVKSFKELNLPEETLQRLCTLSRGLILIAGVTGSGKTTTMNSMLDYINQHFAYKVITVEDPIEYYHHDRLSSISQREVGSDTQSFQAALRHVLRQDPDVIVIGEMRDYEAMIAGLTAAETGHLVLSTIHTMDAVQTVDRMVGLCPPHQQFSVRLQIANVLKGIVAQRLLTRMDGQGQVPITEVLIGTSLIKKLVADGKSFELYRTMEQGEFYGMHTFDQDLLRLLQKGLVTPKEAMDHATNSDDFMLKLRGIDREAPGSMVGT